MTNTCKVVRLDGENCVLQTLRQEACKNCGANCIGCGKLVTITVKNTVGAQVGDEVSVTTSSVQFLCLCALVFLTPVAAGIALLFLGNAIGGAVCGGIAGAAAFVAALAGAILFVRRKSGALAIRIEKITNPS